MNVDLFSKQADLYARFRPQYPEEIYKFLHASCPTRDLAWDCATGNGQAAAALSRYFRKVIATDLSEKQIQSATKADNVEYRVLPAEEPLPVKPQSVDLITVAQALHWFELDKFYREVKRLLKPKGVFATWGYAFHAPIQPEIDAFLKDFYFNTLGPFWKPNNRLLWDKYKNLDFPFSELIAPKVELSVKWSLNDLIGFFKTWSSTQLFIEKHRIDPTLRLHEKILSYWGSPSDVKVLKWDMVFRVGCPYRSIKKRH